MHTLQERFLLHFIKIKTLGIKLSDILESKNIKSICIYGAGMLGNVLFDELANSNVAVNSFIDRRAKALNRSCRGIPVILPEEAGELENTDAIVVSPYYEYFPIRSYQKRYTSFPILSLRDIVSEALSEQEFIDFSSWLTERGVKLFAIHRPSIKAIDNPSVLEQALMSKQRSFWMFEEKELFEYLFPDVDAPDIHRYLIDLISNFVFYGQNDEAESPIKDIRSKDVNIINGYRYIPAAPDEADNTVYVFGDCAADGSYADDTRTFANNLQLLLNTITRRKFRVAAIATRIANIHYLIKKIESLSLTNGDVIVFIPHPWMVALYDGFYSNLPNIYSCDLTRAFSRPHDYGELFCDDVHFTYKGFKELANIVFKCLSSSGVFDAPAAESRLVSTLPPLRHESGLKEDLQAYKAYLGEQKTPIEGKAGAIVMNCNPFTNGHRYLIEYAAGQVDYLYIFVVEEDRSFFPFADRFELVKEGTKDLDNVKVLKSGKFIISTVTFEGYFNKEDMPEAEIDASEDVTIFATEIAPILNITIRFAGSEPIDKITRQYNRDMARILPAYGIEFREIERRVLDGKAISASLVRSHLVKNELEALRKYVPDATYAYLMREFAQ